MAICTEQVNHTHRSKSASSKMTVNRARQLSQKIMKLITIDGDNFSNSKDWPYLWSKHK